jgi:hypothetical protein
VLIHQRHTRRAGIRREIDRAEAWQVALFVPRGCIDLCAPLLRRHRWRVLYPVSGVRWWCLWHRVGVLGQYLLPSWKAASADAGDHHCGLILQLGGRQSCSPAPKWRAHDELAGGK